MINREKVIGNLTSLRERLKWQKDIQGYGVYISFVDNAIDLLKEQDNCENCAIAIEDRQPIVRCKECKYLIDHYGFMDDGYCENMRETYGLKFKPEDDWFCADGERKKLEGEA